MRRKTWPISKERNPPEKLNIIDLKCTKSHKKKLKGTQKQSAVPEWKKPVESYTNFIQNLPIESLT